MKRSYHYTWLHIPSGQTGTKEFQCYGKKEFLEKLSHWNRAGTGIWQYFEASYLSAEGLTG